MPMPALAGVVVLKNDCFGVPALGDLQRAFIYDRAFEGLDLTNLTKADHKEIKKKTLASKPFQHCFVDPDADAQEEANMAEKIRAAVALERQSKGKTTSTDNGDSARGTDVDANRQDLRGFPILGWERAIQKVIGNAVDAAKGRALKKAKPSVASGVHSGVSSLSSTDAMRILDLMEYTPRAKFTTDKHEEILALACTYTGGNPGANFNRAAKALWAQADQDQWAAATEAELAAIPPAERMALLKSAFCTALSKIQDSGRFPSFVATLQLGYHDEDYNRMAFEVGEAFPLDSEVVPGFQSTREIECESYLGHLHAWAAVPLKDLARLKSTSATTAEHPVFELSLADVEELTPSRLTIEVIKFLTASYHHVYGTCVIPWAAVIRVLRTQLKGAQESALQSAHGKRWRSSL
ncbi:hypothetical protein C8F01DRAFT_1084488 [Mycena amicta]|nr:hypothetical protein C8F01DRAFT_1084488 [Mycena amicta]